MDYPRPEEATVKRDLLLPVAIILSVSTFFAAMHIRPVSLRAYPDVLLVFALFFLLAVLHELAHYASLKAMGKYARMTTMLRWGLLVVEYDELRWGEYVAVALAPQVALQLPLTLAFLASGSAILWVLAVLHFCESMGDLVGASRALLLLRGSVFRLYKVGGRIKGYIVVRPDGRVTVYRV